MSARIARIGWYALLAALAVLATVAQVDRRSRYNRELVALVPPGFAGFSAEQRTRAALERRDGERALAEARQLLRYRPLPADHLTLLALAEAQAGDPSRATSALEAAAARGWREPLPQAASAQAALAQGSYDIAAQRVVALLATGELPDQARQLFAQIIASPDGQAAMARRYPAGGHWQANSLTGAAAQAEPPDVARMLELALEEGAELPCDALQRLAENFTRRGFAEDAARFRPDTCPRAPR